MLDYVKLILEKVSFDPHLFEKELIKNMKELLKEDLYELKIWCFNNFGDIYMPILEKHFA